jgi:4-alpha-glucanotransferase
MSSYIIIALSRDFAAQNPIPPPPPPSYTLYCAVLYMCVQDYNSHNEWWRGGRDELERKLGPK